MSKWFVLEGDWGGQIYATVPVDLTSARRVLAALAIVDAIEWHCNDGEGARAHEMEGEIGEGVDGGMGGGLLTRNLWAHWSLAPMHDWLERFLFGNESLPHFAQMMEWFCSNEWNRAFYADDQGCIAERMCGAFNRATEFLQIKVKLI